MRYLGLICIGCLISVAIILCNQNKKSKVTKINNFSSLMKEVPLNAKLAEDNYFVWGASVVKDIKGKYHMYYSRWPKKYGFEAWVTHSEIAHAVSDSPFGPFKFKDVAFLPRGTKYWDGLVTHNPTVKYYNNKYYLYYMGTTGTDEGKRSYWEFRNNQRIGVAFANNPDGPWYRTDTPVIDVSQEENSNDALMTSNPSVTKMKDGKFLMIYKCVGKMDKLPFGGPVSHMIAISDFPTGPFVKHNERIFSSENSKFSAEDPFVWYDEDAEIYYAIIKDMTGWASSFDGVSLSFLTSNNGFEWKAAKHPLASHLEIKWEDGTLQKVNRLERPQVLIENGKPIAFYCAVADSVDGVLNSFNIHIPLKRF